MEGSRHEKVVLVILAYIIGFCTAFVWFGSGTVQQQVRYHYDTFGAYDDSNSFVKKKASAEAEGMQVASTAEEARLTSAYTTYENGELRFVRDDIETLLSVATSEIAADATASLEPGVHVELVAHSVSPDGRYVHFCEGNGGEYCRHYVYDVEAEMIRPVRESSNGGKGEPLTTSHSVATQTRWDGDRLVVGEHHADDGDPVWMLHHH